MAKLLHKTPPKSSMTRLLDEQAIAGALGTDDADESPAAHTTPQSPPTLRVVDSPPAAALEPAPSPRPIPPRALARVQAKSTLVRGGELYLTDRSNQILEELISTFRTNTNRAVAPTHVLRGILLALQPHLPKIRQEAAAAGPLKRPGNETQYALEREEFEKAIGEMVLTAVKG